MIGKGVGLDRSGEAARALASDCCDPRVLVVGGPVDELGLGVDVAVEDLADL
jgi:hypothetical protein